MTTMMMLNLRLVVMMMMLKKMIRMVMSRMRTLAEVLLRMGQAHRRGESNQGYPTTIVINLFIIIIVISCFNEQGSN